MVSNQFTLPVPNDKARRLVTGWLSLGLAALVIPGLFAILIVLSRTPFLQDIVPGKDFFRTALVIHVDLTVLVWFIAFAGVFWSYTDSLRALRTAPRAGRKCSGLNRGRVTRFILVRTKTTLRVCSKTD